MSEKYSFESRPGRQDGAPNNAAECAQALNEIEAAYGEITPPTVVETARDPASPLHPHFEWDDAIAASEHRLSQARVLIASIRVQITDVPDRGPTRVFVHVPAKTPYYLSTEKAMSDEQTRAMILDRALQELASFRKRYAELSELAELFGEIDDLTKRLSQIQGDETPRPPRRGRYPRYRPPQR